MTTATLSSGACQTSIDNACNAFTSSTLTPTALEETKQSCLDSNDYQDDRHMNWQVYAKKIECPAHLTEVTGCMLAPQGLPAANPAVVTPAEAAGDPTFRSLSGDGQHYTTTTMQDCCKPSCAWQDYVTGTQGGLTTVGEANSFYTCDATGTPLTE